MNNKATHKKVPESAFTDIGYYFYILSEPLRLRLLNLLREREYSVSELAQVAESSLANVSRHLSLMAKHGLITRNTRGTSVFYRIEDQLVFELCNLVCDKLLERLQQLQKTQQQFIAR